MNGQSDQSEGNFGSHGSSSEKAKEKQKFIYACSPSAAWPSSVQTLDMLGKVQFRDMHSTSFEYLPRAISHPVGSSKTQESIFLETLQKHAEPDAVYTIGDLVEALQGAGCTSSVIINLHDTRK